MKRALGFESAWAAAVVLTAACGPTPVQLCSLDSDCRAGGVCVQGYCTRTPADAGFDGGHVEDAGAGGDAGEADAGSDAGISDAGVDAGDTFDGGVRFGRVSVFADRIDAYVSAEFFRIVDAGTQPECIEHTTAGCRVRVCDRRLRGEVELLPAGTMTLNGLFGGQIDIMPNALNTYDTSFPAAALRRSASLTVVTSGADVPAIASPPVAIAPTTILRVPQCDGGCGQFDPDAGFAVQWDAFDGGSVTVGFSTGAFGTAVQTLSCDFPATPNAAVVPLEAMRELRRTLQINGEFTAQFSLFTGNSLHHDAGRVIVDIDVYQSSGGGWFYTDP